MIDVLIKLDLLALVIVAIAYVAVDTFMTPAPVRKKPVPKPGKKREEKKLQVPEAVRENPDMFVYVDGRVKLKSQL